MSGVLAPCRKLKCVFSISAFAEMFVSSSWSSDLFLGMLGMSHYGLFVCFPCSDLSSGLQERGNLRGSRNLQLSGGMAGRRLPYR